MGCCQQTDQKRMMMDVKNHTHHQQYQSGRFAPMRMPAQPVSVSPVRRIIVPPSPPRIEFQSVNQQLTPKKESVIVLPREQPRSPIRLKRNTPIPRTPPPVTTTSIITKDQNAGNFTFNQDIENSIRNMQSQFLQLEHISNSIISSIKSEKISQDRVSLQEIKQLLDLSWMDRKGLDNTLSLLQSGQTSLNASTKTELNQLHQRMVAQQQVIAALIRCLSDRLDKNDKENVKVEVDNFRKKINELGMQLKASREGTDRLVPQPPKQLSTQHQSLETSLNQASIENRIKHILKESRISMQSVRTSSGTVYLCEQQDQVKKQSTQASLQKVKAYDQKIDTLISKLESINQSYRTIGQSSGSIIDLDTEEKHFKKLKDDRRSMFIEFLNKTVSRQG